MIISLLFLATSWQNSGRRRGRTFVALPAGDIAKFQKDKPVSAEYVSMIMENLIFLSILSHARYG